MKYTMGNENKNHPLHSLALYISRPIKEFNQLVFSHVIGTYVQTRRIWPK